MNKALKILGIITGIIIILIIAAAVYINAVYPVTGPPPEITVVSNPELELRGGYLANNVAACISCHSHRDWSKYAGPVISGTEGMGGEKFLEEMGYPGKIYSKNITPYNLKNWTDGELVRSITSGVDKQGKALFPIMPYMNYNMLSERDLHAIVAYIRSLKAVSNDVPDSEVNFPMSIIMKLLPPEGYTPKPGIEPSDSVAYGEYITTIASCSDCHTPTSSGEPIPGKLFAGGKEFIMEGGTVRSPNITPDTETGIGSWTKSMFINRFKSFMNDSVNLASNIEFNTTMPWISYAGMTEEDLGAIYDYLRTLPPVKNQVSKFTPKGRK